MSILLAPDGKMSWGAVATRMAELFFLSDPRYVPIRIINIIGLKWWDEGESLINSSRALSYWLVSSPPGMGASSSLHSPRLVPVGTRTRTIINWWWYEWEGGDGGCWRRRSRDEKPTRLDMTCGREFWTSGAKHPRVLRLPVGKLEILRIFKWL